MRHPLDREIGTSFSYQVLQLRRLRGELGSSPLDSQNLRLHPLPSQVVERHAVIGDPDLGQVDLDEAMPFSLWHFRGKRKGRG